MIEKSEQSNPFSCSELESENADIPYQLIAIHGKLRKSQPDGEERLSKLDLLKNAIENNVDIFEGITPNLTSAAYLEFKQTWNMALNYYGLFRDYRDDGSYLGLGEMSLAHMADMLDALVPDGGTTI